MDPEAQAQAEKSWRSFLDWMRNHLGDLGTAQALPMGYRGVSPGGGQIWNANYVVPRTLMGPGGLTGGVPGGGNPSQFAGLEGQNGLPSGLLNAVYGVESNYGRNVGPSSAGALGPFQFMPVTWGAYGRGGNPMDLGDAAAAAGRYFHKLLDQFRGDTAKALAGYNWGEENVEKDVAAHGARWRDFLPAETKKYINRILPQVGSAPPGQVVAIRIYNNTGGSAIVQASAMSA
jgi:soluble lytic murein transglycosylase-like protein